MSKEKYKVLIITGIVTDEHDPRVNPMLRRMLESTGKFEVKITESFKGSTAESLEDYDCVILNYDGKKNIPAPYVSLGKTAEKALYDFVASGKGIVLYHSAMLMGSPEFPEEYEKLVGGTLKLHNGGNGRKNPKIQFSVDTVYGDPICEGMPESWITAQDDLFFNMAWRDDVNIEVLATCWDGVEDYDLTKMQTHLAEEFAGVDFASLPGMNTNQPVVWKHTYGKGRVFVPAIGHGPDTLLRAPFVALMCRGVEWACSGEVTIPYPDIQGARRINAWPFYDDMTLQNYVKLAEGR